MPAALVLVSMTSLPGVPPPARHSTAVDISPCTACRSRSTCRQTCDRLTQHIGPEEPRRGWDELAWEDIALDRVAQQSHTAFGLASEEGDLERRGRWSVLAERLMPLVRRRAGRLLSRRQREVVARVLAGQSQSEIGRNLGISKVTVFHILRRARHRFRAEFARRGITSLVAYEATMAETKRCVGLDSKECSNEPSGSDGLCRSCRMRKNRAIERDTFQAKIAELAATVEFLEGKCTAAVQAVGHASRERDEAVKQAAESRIAVEQIERRMEWIMAGLTQRLISADELHLLWTPGGGQRGAA